MSDKTLSEQAKAMVVPHSFRVGATLVKEGDGVRAEGGISYDRTAKNLWGVSAYAKAYWEDKPLVPVDKFGYVIGFDVKKEFK